MRRPTALLLAATLGLGLLPAVAIADECDTVPELGPRACASVEAGRTLAGGVCDQVPAAPADGCGELRGLTVDPTLVDAYISSDLAALHALQRDLGTALPLRTAQVLSSHNSYNASAYQQSVAGSDPNQYYGIADQLRMEMRQIELDVHTWYAASDGDVQPGGQPVLCHATGPHLGCSADQPLADGLAEIRGWLDANPTEVIMIDVESHLDGAAGYDAGAAVVDAVLGDVLYRPPTGAPCADLPLDTSFDDVLAAGAQVLIVSSCGSGDAWGGLVHGYGAWQQGRLGSFDADTCGPSFDRAAYDTGITRFWEDTTWLSAMAGGRGPRLDAATLVDAQACGLTFASLDRLHPADDRLEALLWSWSLDATPQDAPVGAQAVLGTDVRLHVADAGTSAAALLCRRTDGSFEVAAVAGGTTLHATDDAALLDLLCGDGMLTTPRSAREMQLVREAVAAHEALLGPLDGPVLTAYARTDAGWVAR